jgi:RNA polymerase sigma-70 factor, ECF subfamily
MADLSKEQGPTESAEERLLLAAARNGDADAMGRLLLLHQDRIFRTTLHLMGGDHDAASDAAQEALLSAWRNIGTFRGESRFSTWLHRIAVNCARNLQVSRGRQARRVVPMEGIDEEAPPREFAASGPSPRDQAVGGEMMGHLHEGLAQLPLEFREPLVLRYIEDRSYEEIAEILQLPLGTVKSRINRARRDLRLAMANHLNREGEPT